MATTNVRDSFLYYDEVGAGDPVLFLHGNPTSSFLWRNVVGQVARTGRRCIAVDLIGMGQSGKPDIEYRLADHIAYLDAFVDRLGLTDLVMVGHDWGAVLALDHARRFPDRMKGVAFLEGHIRPIAAWDDMDAGSRQLFGQLRTPDVADRLILEENFFLEKVLPAGVIRELTTAELDAYRRPFLEPRSRLPMLRWPQEIPIAGEPADVEQIVTANQTVIADPALPKLLLHGRPGAVIAAPEVAWCRAHGQNLTVTETGPGIHFLPEDHPDELAQALINWLATL